MLKSGTKKVLAESKFRSKLTPKTKANSQSRTLLAMNLKERRKRLKGWGNRNIIGLPS